MKAEFEKHMLIASELLSYCHLRGAQQFRLDIQTQEGETVFSIQASPARVSPLELELARKKLNMPRRHEVEQNYWGLSGESESTSELALVGMMCDGAQVECENGQLSITIKRFA